MTLITCPDCQREISSQAPACPGCGRVARSSGGVGRAIRWAILAIVTLVTSMVAGSIGLWFLFSPRAAVILRQEGLLASPAPRATPIGPVGHITFLRERDRERVAGFIEGRATFVNDSEWWLIGVLGECTARDPNGKDVGSGPFMISYEHGDARVPPDSTRSQRVTVSVYEKSSRVREVTCAVEQTFVDLSR